MEIFDTLIDSIAEHGYGIADDFLDASEVAVLSQTLRNRYIAGIFKNAGVGQGAEHQVHTQIRGDHVLWLEENTTQPEEQLFFEKINTLRQYLNQTCYLGLRDFEFHYALYPVGTFYKRHLDRFRHDSRRKMSVICYLNEAWQPTDGGELVIYLPENQSLKVSPTAGRLVCFEADKLEHEVLPAIRERMSITGWLRTGA
ncbi:MAG: 2OG-Fe(II) oxygenase [Spirosomaceae bacterium]|jgi:SM-20-related protein|nr:2OG-Fe(II) oxygenase [Spirosomataceae bacterium]